MQILDLLVIGWVQVDGNGCAALFLRGVGLQQEAVVGLAGVVNTEVIAAEPHICENTGGRLITRVTGVAGIARIASARGHQCCGRQGKDHCKSQQQGQKPSFNGDFHENAPFLHLPHRGKGAGAGPLPWNGFPVTGTKCSDSSRCPKS